MISSNFGKVNMNICRFRRFGEVHSNKAAGRPYKDILPGTKPEEPGYGVAEWRRRHALRVKFVSAVLALIFLNDQAGWAQSGKAVWAQTKPADMTSQAGVNGHQFDIPHDIASTQEAVMNGGKETIIQIQDAHASLSAQYSIAALLDKLVTDYDLSLVAIEGSAGYIDTSLLKSFPDEKVRKDTAAFLMREGRMSAGEFFAITSDKDDITLYGIEDDALYKENVESFRRVAAGRAVQTENLDNLLGQLSALSEKMCSKDLNTFNKNCVLHRAGRMSFSGH